MRISPRLPGLGYQKRTHLEFLQRRVLFCVREGCVQDIETLCHFRGDDPYPLKGGRGREPRVRERELPGNESDETPEGERFDASDEWGQLGNC